MPYNKLTHKYEPPTFEYYVLTRDNTDVTINSVLKGNNPLYGMGSWDLFAGPFHTWDEACNLGLPWWDVNRGTQ